MINTRCKHYILALLFLVGIPLFSAQAEETSVPAVVTIQTEVGPKPEAVKSLPAVTEQAIKNATLAMFVEALPNGAKTKWSMGNHPDGLNRDPSKSNVRAICLGQEDDKYVFLTLRYFLDPTYPNHHIHGIETPPRKGTYSDNRNARYTQFLAAERIWLTDVRHTGGGQLDMNQSSSFTVRNRIFLKRCGMVARFTRSCSTIDGERYNDLAKGEWKATTVRAMNQELEAGKHAFVETFADHDVALIKVPVKNWKRKLVTLGLQEPTETIRLLTDRQVDLYGFKFILLSQDAFSALRAYQVKEQPNGKEGLYLAVLGAASLISFKWVAIIVAADKVLSAVFKKAGINEATLLSKGVVSKIGQAILKRK
jgi:hypothetical protein